MQHKNIHVVDLIQGKGKNENLTLKNQQNFYDKNGMDEILNLKNYIIVKRFKSYTHDNHNFVIKTK